MKHQEIARKIASQCGDDRIKPKVPEACLRFADKYGRVPEFEKAKDKADVIEMAGELATAERAEPVVRVLHESHGHLRQIMDADFLCEQFEDEIHNFREIAGLLWHVDPIVVDMSDPSNPVWPPMKGHRKRAMDKPEACEKLQQWITRDREAIAKDQRSDAYFQCLLEIHQLMRASMPTHELLMPTQKTLMVPARPSKSEAGGYEVCDPRMKNSGPWIVQRASSSTLDRLAILVETIERQTPFDQAPIVWWILTKQRPELPRIRTVERVRGFSFFNESEKVETRSFSWIESQIFAVDLKFEEYRKAYVNIRRQWERSRRQTPKPLHQAIFRLVRRAGEPGGPGGPKRHSRSYWGRIRQQLIDEGIEEVPRWEAIDRAYWRLVKPLAPNHDITRGKATGRIDSRKKAAKPRSRRH